MFDNRLRPVFEFLPASVAMLSALALNWAWEGTIQAENTRSTLRFVMRYVLFVVIGGVIPPLITGMLHRVFFGQSQFLFLYEAVVAGPTALLIFKSAYLLVVFPALMIMATHTPPPPKAIPDEAADPATAKAA